MLPDINSEFITFLIFSCVRSDMYNIYMTVGFVWFGFFKCGAPCGARTHDPEIMS